MKKIIGMFVLAAMTTVGSALACEGMSAGNVIMQSQSVSNLLEKAATTLNAECGLVVDEFGSIQLEVNYQNGDDTRRSGKVTRTFQGDVDCAREDGSVLRRIIRGTATIKFIYSPQDQYCDEMVNEHVLKIKAKMKI
ncbi:MAG TPA: hypothetical protein VNJ01_17535 [Bacteriovoracaceae bacterium]|nr:hypothetical protein [Bacteriovoracaceae bacterium]